MTASVAAAVWAVFVRGLNFIQAGGILFLCMGLLVYFTTVFQKKPAKKATSPEEEVLLWEQELKEDGDTTVFLGSPVPEKYPVLVSMDPGKQGKYRSRPGSDDRWKTERAGRYRSFRIFGEQDPCFSGKKRRRLVSQGQRFHKRDFFWMVYGWKKEKKKKKDGMEIRFSGRRFCFHSDSTGSTVQKHKCLEMKKNG